MQPNKGEPMMSNHPEFFSVGHLCAMLTRLPKHIQHAAAELGEQPTIINGLDHYAPDQAERIREYFRNTPSAPESVVA